MKNKVLLTALSSVAMASAGAAADRPNILFIMLDEMRWNAMGNEGNTIVRTPNLDALAAQSVKYEKTYSVSPVSCPARKSLFTGRYPHIHGVQSNDVPANDGEIDLPLILRHYGYTTAIAGKLHYVPVKYDWGFDYFWTYHLAEGPAKLEGYVPYMEKKYSRSELTKIPGPFPKDPLGGDLGTFKYPAADFEANWITDRTIEFLKMQKGSKKPFFIFTSILQPHSNYVGCEPYASMYRPEDMPVAKPIPAMQEQRLKMVREGKDMRAVRGFAPPPEIAKACLAAYYGHITCVDDNVGRMLGALKELGLDKNTIVVFTADHGNMLGDHGRWFKGQMYEGACHIPLFIRAAPDSELEKYFKPGDKVTQLVEQTDIMPTLLDMASLPVPDGVQGRSVVPLMKGDTEKWKNRVFAELYDYMIYEGDFKLILIRKKRDNLELYNMKNDPAEENNLAKEPQYRNMIEAMLKKIDRWQAEKPAPVKIDGFNAPPYLYRKNFEPDDLKKVVSAWSAGPKGRNDE